MAAVTTGTRLERKQNSEIKFQSLGDETTTSALAILHTLIRTSFSTSGQLKVLHNNSGGHAVVTSCSARLLTSLSVSNPVLRLLTTAIQGFISTYSDGGLFTGLFALNLIQNSLGLDIHRRLLMETHELLLQHCLEYLYSPQCNCKQILDLGKLDHLKKLVQCVISPKVGCGLSTNDTEHITDLVVRAFLKTFQGMSESSVPSKQGIVNYINLEGRPASESQIIDGVLFAAPQISIYSKRKLEVPKLPDGSIRVAVFTTSLAGDHEDLEDAVYELSVDDSNDHRTDLSSAVMSTLEKMVSILLTARVGLICCQRVIHPKIKRLFHEEGILAIDRLGSPHIHPVQGLTGATLLSSFLHPPQDGAYGVLDAVSHMVLGGRSYLHLVKHTAPVCTLVLCQRTESASEELKHVVTVSEDVLRLVLHHPIVVGGGGCWQVHLAAYLRHTLEHHKKEWCKELSCSPSQLSQTSTAFCLALEQVAMATSNYQNHVTDSENYHHWLVSPGTINGEDWSKEDLRCACGMTQTNDGTEKQFFFLGRDNTSNRNRKWIEKDSDHEKLFTVVDLFEICVNGLKTGVAAANMVLGTQHYIHDTN